ncbi:MAG: DUF4255 domain-containing protein [Cytophagaceae bacterium]|jgi:hypothetical protein|nr:DUF4255 domain-containing protein [Cytophagaceae bacterium]
MIDQVLDTIASRLNSFLQAKCGLPEDKPVMVSNIIDRDGNYAFGEKGSVVISLMQIQEERVNVNVPRPVGTQPTVSLNLVVMFSSFKYTEADYLTSLRNLSGVISYFQANPLMTPYNTPDLPMEIEKVNAEMLPQEAMNMSQIWGMNGGKQFPAVLYKFRMIIINEATQNFTAGPLSGISFE